MFKEFTENLKELCEKLNILSTPVPVTVDIFHKRPLLKSDSRVVSFFNEKTILNLNEFRLWSHFFNSSRQQETVMKGERLRLDQHPTKATTTRRYSSPLKTKTRMLTGFKSPNRSSVTNKITIFYFLFVKPLIREILFSSVHPSNFLVSVTNPSRALDSPRALWLELQ